MELYSHTIGDRVIGCYLLNPELIVNSKYPIEKTDFATALHSILFVTIYNLYTSGCQTINIMDINEWLKPYEAQYNIYCDNRGDEYVATITELTDAENFEYYYEQLRKFSCLRYYQENGFNIDKFYDVTKSEESQLENLNMYDIDTIIQYYDSIQLDARQMYLGASSDIEETHGGEGLLDLKQRLQEIPLYGSSFTSDNMNAITRGLMDGQLTCFSSPSGVGKSSVSVATMANLCVPKLWDYEQNTFVDNPCKTRNGGLYIQFELDNVQELSLKFIAFISGIGVNTILNGKYTDEENYRIDTAIQIFEQSNIHMVYMPNFTRRLIDDAIKAHIIKYKIDIVMYDYIQEGSALNAEMNKSNGGIGLRTDQVLANMSDFLKFEARQYNIPIYTCTQTNANLGSTEVVGVESIAGSRAVANKLDIGGVFLGIRPKEQKAYETIKHELGEKGFHVVHPTHIYHMYKVRFGSYPQNIKVWVNLDLGTGRMRDCFCTDWQNKLVKVNAVRLVKKGAE